MNCSSYWNVMLVPISALLWQMWDYHRPLTLELCRAQALSAIRPIAIFDIQLLLAATLLLNRNPARVFVECLERAWRRYRMWVYGYVVMPEHVHLLVSEPEVDVLATTIQSLRVSCARSSKELRLLSSSATPSHSSSPSSH